MKQLKLNNFIIAFAFITVLASCHKDKLVQKSDTPTAQRAGIYILNQGEYGDNNSTLTYYDYTSKNLIPDQYSVANSAVIGDTGNDIEIYGSKMYIVVNVSSVVDIVDPKTSKLIKQDSLVSSSHVAREPRSIAFYKGNAFITSYDGTVAVMDTATLAITKYITVGNDPEQLVVANNKLYVANSGGLSVTGFDNTVSVIDLNTLTQTKKVTVITNPVSMAADAYGNVYVLSLGDYDKIAGGMTIIDSKTDLVKSQPEVSLGYIIPITVKGDSVYYLTANNKVAIYNAKTQSHVSDSFITDGTQITTPYTIAADPTTGEVFVTDAKDYASNGTLYAFDKTGKKEYSITVGINPGKVTLVNK
jgi:YVTN family beta-propeller protein